jgi:hypothetical protein
MLQKLPVNLPKYYLSESLETESLKKVLDSSASVYKNVLTIRNGVKSDYEFATLENENYELVAIVKVNYALVGKAKSQAWIVTHYKSLLGVKPNYKLLCGLKDLRTNKFIYKHSVVSIKPETIYKNIEDCYTDLQILLDSF